MEAANEKKKDAAQASLVQNGENSENSEKRQTVIVGSLRRRGTGRRNEAIANVKTTFRAPILPERTGRVNDFRGTRSVFAEKIGRRR